MNQHVHRQINNLLAGIVIVVSLYALLLPFIAHLNHWVRQRNPDNRERIVSQLQAGPQVDTPADNRLLIPDILVDEPIVTGSSLGVIEDGGVWLRPRSAEPNGAGNIVLAGHRFTYRQPLGPLYHLDDVTLGDEIGLRWEGELRRFIVEDIRTVTSQSTGIEAQTEDTRLTIYTCTPLLTAEHRLVITAREQT